MPSWDGVPLDVDVTLPATGDGPFPTIVMMHGWGGSKGSFEAHSPAGAYNNVYFASRGYAVVNYTARGWGRSCGSADSRTSPGCDRGWIHLGDHRYEARDTQHLLGLLVDQGVTSASAIGATGVSYGGIQTLNLARLRNRVRMEDGSFVPWTSPNGTPLAIKAGYARWPGSDMGDALQPNGRFTDFRTPRSGDSRRPPGVQKKSYLDILYAAGWTDDLFPGPRGAAGIPDLQGRAGRPPVAPARRLRASARPGHERSGRARDAHAGLVLLRLLPQGPGQRAAARERLGLYAGLHGIWGRELPLPGEDLGAPPSEDGDHAPQRTGEDELASGQREDRRDD